MADSIDHFELDKSPDDATWTPVVNPVPGNQTSGCNSPPCARQYDTPLLPGTTYYRLTGVTVQGVRFEYNHVPVTVAASGDPRWHALVSGLTSYDNASIRGIAIDPRNHDVVITGWFQAVVSCQGTTITNADTANVTDYFVARISGTGVLKWIKRWGGQASEDYARSVAVDSAGNIIVCGTSNGTLDFGDGVLSHPVGAQDGFLVKYDENGNHLWHSRFNAGAGSQVTTLDVFIGPSDSILFDGTMTAAINLGGGPIAGGLGYVARFSSSGSHVWSRASGLPADIRVVGTRVYTTGFFYGSSDLGAGSPVTAVGTTDAYVTSFLVADGTSPVVRHYGGANIVFQGSSVAIEAGGVFYLTGAISGSGSVDLGNGHVLTHSSNIGTIFLARFDSSGNCQYAFGYGQGVSAPTFVNGIRIDTDGNLVLAGGGNDGITFDSNVPQMLGSGKDIWICRLRSTDAALIWQERMLTFYEDEADDIQVDLLNRQILIGGFFGGDAHFGNGPTFMSGTNAYKNGFVLNLSL